MADPSASRAPGDPEIKEEEIDASIEDTINPNPNPSAETADEMNLDSTNELDPVAPALEPKIPAKKDASLREFMSKMDDYAPIIPDAVTNYYLTLAGLPPTPQTPPHLARLLALAAQKFIADIAADAYQYSRIRASNTSSSNPMGGLGATAGLAGASQGAAAGAGTQGGKEQGKGQNLGVQRPGFGGGGQGGGGQGRTVLTMEDLGMAVGEYGVNVRRSEFYR